MAQGRSWARAGRASADLPTPGRPWPRPWGGATKPWQGQVGAAGPEGGPSSGLSTPSPGRIRGAGQPPHPDVATRGTRLREAGQDPKHRGFGQGKGRLCRMSQCRREPGESWGCGGLWVWFFFFSFFPAESSNLSPAFWDPGGTVETPRGQALGGDGSAGRCGRQRPAPLGNRPPREEPPAAMVMLHFPSLPGPAPHPPSGSRRCKSRVKAPGGKGGRGRRGPAHTVFQPCRPPRPGAAEAAGARAP